MALLYEQFNSYDSVYYVLTLHIDPDTDPSYGTVDRFTDAGKVYVYRTSCSGR